MVARAKSRKDLPRFLVLALISTLLPLQSGTANAAVPSARQLTIVSPNATTPASVASRYFGNGVATSADGSRSVIGESGSTGIGGEVYVYDCTNSGCTSSATLNALATRTVSITQISITGKKATATTSSAHGFLPGEKITITGTGNSVFNVTNKEISDTTNNTISFYANSSDLAATSVSGSGVVDLAPSNSGFGSSVDISDNGNLVLVGAPSFDVSYTQYTSYSSSLSSTVNRRFGRAYLFEYISGAWALAKVFDRAVPSDLDKYGTAVGISGDGAVSVITSSKNASSVSNTAEILVNTPNPSASPGPSGTPVIYSSWVLQQTISTTSGLDVDISDNGNVIVLPGDYATVGGFSSAGNAYIYMKSGSTWALSKTLARTDISGQTNGVNNNFGYGVAVSDDGNTVATFSYQSPDVYVYRYSGGAWGTPVNVDLNSQTSRSKKSIALSADGNVVMLGLGGATVGCYENAGAVAFIEYSGGSWAQNGNLRSAGNLGASKYFGFTVAMSEDGASFALAGAPWEPSNGLANVGSVTTFGAFLSNSETTAPTLSLSQGCTNTVSTTTTTLQSDPTSNSSIKFNLTSDESLDSSTISGADFTITNGTYTSASCYSTYCIITVTATSTGVVTIDLSGSFSISDTQGNAATTAGGTDRSVTYDNQAPTLTSSTPVDDATGIAVNSNITLTFSEPVVFQTSGSFSLYRNRLSGSAVSVETFSSSSARVTGTGTSTITIDPTSDLLAGYEYYLFVGNTTFKDLSGNAFAGIAANALSFTTITDSTAPTLTSSTPADNGTGFSISSNLVLTFSEDVFAGAGLSVTNKALTSNVATLTTSTAHGLTVGTQVVVTSVDTVFNGTFTVASVPTSTTFTYAKTNTNIASTVVTTNGVVAPISIFIKKVSDNSVFESYAINSSQLTFATNNLTINPTSNLAYLMDYYLEVGTAAVRDNSSNYYAGISGNTTLNFTSAADTVAPTVSTLSPTDGSTTVSINQNLILNFSEIVNQGAGNIVIYQSTGTVFESIPVNDPRISGWGTAVLTINPSGSFAGSVAYYVNIPSGAIVDVANNSYIGITNTTSWNFTVSDTTAPSLVSIETNSSGNQIILTYNENLATSASYLPATSQFSLSVAGVGVAITARSVATTKVTLTPATTINPGQVVTLSYTDSGSTGDIQDSAFNDAPSFTTQAVTNLVVPKVTGVTSPTTDGTYNPGATISIEINFSGSVTVTGAPTLLLETGSNDRLAAYTGGSGTSTLTFSYTVQTGDSSGDLDYNSTSALVLNGGSISNTNGAAVLTLPTPGATNSLGANKAIVISSGPLSVNLTPSSISYVDTSTSDDFLDQTGVATGIGSGTYIFGITGGTTYATTSNIPPNTAVVKYTVGKVGTYGTLWLVNTTDPLYVFYHGNWRYVPNDVTINALTANASETFEVTIDNGTTTSTNNLTISLTGVNDRPNVAISTSNFADFSPIPATTTCGFDTPYSVDLGEMPAAETCNYAFDNQDGTKFLNFDQNSSLLIDAGAVYTLTGIGMTTGNDFISRDPVTFTIYGSNVSRTSGMTKIATITNVTAPIDRGALYPAMNFANSSSYRFYKITWQSVRTPLEANSVQIAEIRLIGFSGGTLTYTEGQAAQTLEGGFTLSDLDGQIVGATVKISSGLTTGDLLALNVDTATMGAVTSSYNASTGLLTLSGTATSTQYQNALRAVKFSSTSTNPTALYSSRTVAWEITDSTGLKNTSVVTSIAVISVNDAPALTDLTPKSLPENSAAQLLDNSVTITDGDSPNFFEGSIRVAGLLAGDVVAISTTTAASYGAIRKAGLEVQWSDGNAWQKMGVISGGVGTDLLITFTTVSATRAIVESIIEALLVSSTSVVTSRTFTITLDDGDGSTSTGGTIVVTITDATPPTVTLTPALIKNTGSVVASSSENGKIYLVRSDQIVTSEASILALLDFYWNVAAGVLASVASSIDAAGLSDGSFVAYAVDDAGNLSAASTDVIQISGSAPTAGVLSNISSPTKLSSIVFQLAFSEAITGLASGDFSNTGNATGCVFTPSASSGSSFNVTVTGCSEGVLALRLAPNSVVDSSSNAGPPSAVTSASLTIDRTAPTASWTSPAAMATSLPLSYTLTFSESISGLTSDDFVNANTTSAKAVGCVFTPSASSGTTFTVSVTSCSDGILTLRLRSLSVSDGAGNLGTAANSDATAVTLDRAAPVITWLSPTVSGFTTSTSITPNWSVTDGVAVNSAGTVNLMRATLTGDSCGAYTSQGAQVKNANTTLTTGFCYYWTFASAPTDTAANTTTGASLTSAVLKVDTAGTIVTITAPFAITSFAADQPIIYSVVFSRNITGIGVGDFINQGSAVGCVITPQSNTYDTTGSSLTVSVTNCSEGTLILELSANSVFHSGNVAAPGVAFRGTTIEIDRTAPAIITKSPADGAQDIAVNSNIVLTFSEIVNSQIGLISLRTIDGTLVERLSVSDSQVSGFGTDTITINFDRDFSTSTQFYIEIEAGALVDHAGLPFPGMSGPANLLFRTVAGLSQIITFVPTLDKLTTDAPFIPGALADSGLPVFYTSSNTSVAQIINGLLTILSAGTSVITAIQPGNGAYEPAVPVSATLTVSAPLPSGGGGGGGGAPAPATTPVVEEALTRIWKEEESKGLRIRWEGTSKPVRISVISSLNEKFEVQSDKLDSGELLENLKPGLAYSISAIPLDSTKVESQQTIAYVLPPLAPIQLNADQTGFNLIAMTWEQPSYAEKFRVTVTPNRGTPLVFVTSDRNLQVQVSKGVSYRIAVVAIGTQNLESGTSIFDWNFKGVLREGNYAFASGVNNTLVTWTLLEGANAQKYRVVLRGKTLCETTDTSCTLKGLYGGNSPLQIQALRDVVVDQINPMYIPSQKYRLVGRIFFDGFSSNIAKTYTKKIKEMAAFVLVSGFSQVQITGHSDQFKNAPLVKNSTLSTKRAAQVADAMKKLLPKVKFTAVGRGNSSPYKSGKYADPKNRRVQIYTR